MMKKTIAVVLCLMMLTVCLCSCTQGTVQQETSAPESQKPADSSSTPAPEKTDMTAEMHTLFDRNLKCLMSIFELHTLSYEENPMKDTLHKVTDPDFKTFKELKNFVYGTYVEDTAGSFFEEHIPGHPLYSEVDGMLVIDETAIGGKGYYVDWDGYALTVTNATDDRCEFTVTASVEWPAENPVKEPYEKTAVAVKQDGQWLLTEKVY